MRILFFAQLKDVTGCAATELKLGRRLDAPALWRVLVAAHPGLDAFRRSVRLARNGEYAAPDAQFSDDDEVALIPPVSGG